jgi:long-chain acyl-CoA synthetase
MLTPLEAFLAAVKTQPDKVYLRQPLNGVYQDFTWSQVSKKALNIAHQLHKMGITRGDKVAIWSKNCAEWIISDLAIMMAGAVSVPLYPGQSKDTVHYVLEHSEAKVMFVGKHDNDSDVISSIPDGFPVIGFSYYSGKSDLDWDQLAGIDAPIDFKIEIAGLDSLMTIVYTSGTTGKPKGAMHNGRSFAFSSKNGVDQINTGPTDRALSFLPLAHVAERIIIEGQSFYAQFTISFAESLDTFGDNLASVKPTLFFAVPRLWAKFQEGILNKIGGQKKLDRLLSVPIIGKLIARKIRVGLGLNEAHLCASGASPIPRSLIDWFDRIGLEIVEGYGMTENMCYGTFNKTGARKIGSVGRPFAQNEVKISEKGEILFKSEALMTGYYKEPEKTAEALVDGYYHTGDKGRIDDEGYVHITGRVKELFKTSKGKYIAPSPIEGLLTSHVFIDQACVMGSGRAQPLAVIELSDTARASDADTIQAEIEKHINTVNTKLEHHERLDCIVISQSIWTVESGLITPTLKIRRESVEGRYYSLGEISKQLIVWGPKEDTVKGIDAA